MLEKPKSSALCMSLKEADMMNNSERSLVHPVAKYRHEGNKQFTEQPGPVEAVL